MKNNAFVYRERRWKIELTAYSISEWRMCANVHEDVYKMLRLCNIFPALSIALALPMVKHQEKLGSRTSRFRF